MDNRLVKITQITLLLITALSLIHIVSAIPPVASEYYGHVIINSQLAPKNTLIKIFDEDGNPCGSFLTTKIGEYGYASCRGDDSSTEEDEGASNSEPVYFNINGKLAAAYGDTTWKSAASKKVDLVIGNLEQSVPLTENSSQIPINKQLLALFLLLIISPIYYIIIKKIKNELQ